MTNPYIVLGISETASQDEIKTAYRNITKKTHPIIWDVDNDKEKRFHEASEAYAVLSDPVERQAYDDGRAINHNKVNAFAKDLEIAINKLHIEMESYKVSARSELARGLVFTIVGGMITLISVLSGGLFFASMTLAIGGACAFSGYSEYDSIRKYISVKEDELWAKFCGEPTRKETLSDSYVKAIYEMGNSDDSNTDSDSENTHLYYDGREVDNPDVMDNKNAIKYLAIIFAVTMGILLLIYIGTSF